MHVELNSEGPPMDKSQLTDTERVAADALRKQMLRAEFKLAMATRLGLMPTDERVADRLARVEEAEENADLRNSISSPRS